jgi:ABC-type nitrate/sulfonate/bicarbonate transport system substrate-binding protein
MMGTAVLVFALVLGASAPPAHPQALKKVQIGIVGAVSATYYMSLFLAQRKGFFEAEGITTEFVQIAPDDNLVRAVAGGSIGMGIVETSIGINAATRGAPLVVIAGFSDRYPYDLIARPNVKAFADLKGKTVAHWTLAPEVSLMLIRRLMTSNGLREGEYNVIAGGGQPNRYAALSRGAVEAAILTAPYNLIARREGFTVLGGLYDIPAVFAGLIANKTWIARNEDTLVLWLKAVVRGFRYAANHGNRAEVVRLFAEDIKIAPDVVDATYQQFFVENLFWLSWELLPNQRSVQGVMDILTGGGNIPKDASPSTYFDLRYVNRAIRAVGR